MSINLLLAATNIGIKPVAPVVGMGATHFVGSDRYPLFVKEILSPKRVILQEATYRRTDTNGMSESQTYDIQPNPDGNCFEVSLRKNGRWVLVGQSIKDCPFLLGHAQAYQDPSF